MNEAEQKLLWIQLNKEKLSAFAQSLDEQVTSHDLSIADIDSLIEEARRNGRKS